MGRLLGGADGHDGADAALGRRSGCPGYGGPAAGVRTGHGPSLGSSVYPIGNPNGTASAAPLDLSLLRTFLAVHRAGSFTAAARLLGLSQPTVTDGPHVELVRERVPAVGRTW